MANEQEVIYKFTPANPGENLRYLGIPARDLTATDVAKLKGEALRSFTAPGPTGQPMYTKVEHEKKPVSVAVDSSKDEKR